MTAPRNGLSEDEWFESKFVKSPSGCWEWTGARLANGYGVMRVAGKRMLAHRFSASRAIGDPHGLFVCHRCDNPPCVNPSHLFLGTAQDNIRDMQEKGRASGGGLCGEQHSQARLDERRVLEIRERFAAGGITKLALAHEYGVSAVQVGNIVNRTHWRHI